MSIEETVIAAVLKAHRSIKPHLVDGLPGKTPIQMLVILPLQVLEQLERERTHKVTIISGGG